MLSPALAHDDHHDRDLNYPIPVVTIFGELILFSRAIIFLSQILQTT
jgi:hypothetical protein